MKIRVEEIANIKETEIIIKCNKRSDNVNGIIASLRLFDKKVIVKKDGRKFLLNPNNIYYFECVDNKVFCYTEKDVYEVLHRLYEIEMAFNNTMFK